MTANRGIFVAFSSIALLGLMATVVPLAAGPVAAQEVPFIKAANPTTCTGLSTVCTAKFDGVPAGHRWDVTNVACRNNLTSPDVSRESVDLEIRGSGGALVVRSPLLPVNTTNSNVWVVGQEVFAPVSQNKHVEIVVQSFGGAIVAGIVACTISGNNVTLP